MSDQPIEPFENGGGEQPADANGAGGGRDAAGRFAKGNPGGPGNPRSAHARQLRQRLDDALFKACSPDRLLAAVDAVLKLAEAGDVQALKLIFDRIAGPPVAADLAERMQELEERIERATAAARFGAAAGRTSGSESPR